MTVETFDSPMTTKVVVDAHSTAKPMPRGGAELEYPGEHPGQNAMPRGGAELEYPGEYPGQYSNEISKDQTISHSTHGDNKVVAPGFAAVKTDIADPCADNNGIEEKELRPFTLEETIFIFDWDDTMLPSAWVQSQGLRLDEESKVSDFQRQQLNEVADLVIETIRIAKQHGTVVLVTNAERGWIELSCQKFMPTLCPALEGVKLLSARTTYEASAGPSPLDWKLCAFEAELRRYYGDDAIIEPSRRKNVLSLGDSMHEREALLRATASVPNCRAKSLKFMERPDIGQICKQHSLITGCFDRIVHHDGNLDLCIRCS